MSLSLYYFLLICVGLILVYCSIFKYVVPPERAGRIIDEAVEKAGKTD